MTITDSKTPSVEENLTRACDLLISLGYVESLGIDGNSGGQLGCTYAVGCPVRGLVAVQGRCGRGQGVVELV